MEPMHGRASHDMSFRPFHPLPCTDFHRNPINVLKLLLIISFKVSLEGLCCRERKMATSGVQLYYFLRREADD